MNGARATVDTHVGRAAQRGDFTRRDKRRFIPNGMPEQTPVPVCISASLSFAAAPGLHPNPWPEPVRVSGGPAPCQEAEPIAGTKGLLCAQDVWMLCIAVSLHAHHVRPGGSDYPHSAENLKPRGVGILA